MTNVFKKFALAAAVTLAMGVSAQAATYNLGTIDSFASNTFAATSLGKFTDYLQFTVADNSAAALAAQSVYIAKHGLNLESISLYSGSFTAGSTLTGLLGTTSGGNSLTLEYASGLASKAYTLVVTGDAKTLPTGYTSIIQLAPVPEPETYAMLLAGLGVMGFVARRRQKNTQA
ncbi:FxDxF family PEP-CTERM protein [Xylophilus sp. GOD-11R]|uniref:FxDxF family PEP-CTERM protein n=1 Tax=Xylophilus sp. GOD-11R TaxID=3089814 RepID=UPI00298C5BD6|nr:FxDxF family PEP-CTERM protein [Xylophilus sp. GOD-11R]WPB55616.1 FxDxF family PEP-CTERM protein [Xylophilus sp. GOD-11R]